MTSLSWVILTRGDRPSELRTAIDSLIGHDVVVVFNGVEPTIDPSDHLGVVAVADNLGIPGGRDLGVHSTDSDIVAFLDDDAHMLSPGSHESITAAFDADSTLGAVSLRIVDEHGETTRRHIPRFGGDSADRSGPVGTFLGGACAIRRTAYEAAGGYWPELFYAHEELDLSWRLHDAGYVIRYLGDVLVEHPRLPVSRHPEGWWRTGRNRTLIARRNLPLPLAAIHVGLWFAVGLTRAPDRASRTAYAKGLTGARHTSVERRPISWRTVWGLTRAGRPPVL